MSNGYHWSLSKEKFTYILRYYIPCLPQYKEEVTQKRIDELVQFCKENCVGAVMIYVDLNPYWYYMPDSLEHTKYMVDMVSGAAEKLRNAGISYQLNYQNLFGAWDGNVDHRSFCDWGCYVDEFGEESMGCACMIDERFRLLAGEKLRLWAETKPDAIWIDDDFRVHNHRTEVHKVWKGEKGSEERDFGCFCENHINAFNQKYHLNLDRESIRNALLKEEDSGEIGKKWREFIGECYADTAAWVEKTIHSASPDTRVALMTGWADVHAVEGRNWDTMLSALSRPHDPLLRPTYGPYSEVNPRTFISSYFYSEQLRETLIAQYGKNVDYCPEIENTRFTVYSKSIAATSYQMMLSAFQGFGGVTLSIFDLEGCVLSEEPEFAELLAGRKKFCDDVTQLLDESYLRSGVALLTAPDRFVSLTRETEAKRISDLVQVRKMDSLLATTGVPFVYSTPDKLEKHSAFVLDANAVKQLKDEELLICLSKGIFADAGAAREICHRGFGKFLGISVGEKNFYVAASERLLSMKHEDGSEVYIPSRISGGNWREITLSGAEAHSMLVCPDGSEHVGLTYFENELGGRICIYAGDGDFGDSFYTTYRIKLFRKLMRMLSADICITNFKSHGFCAVRENQKSVAVFLTNLATDAAEAITVTLSKTPHKAFCITETGEKHEVMIMGNEVTIPEKLHVYGSVVLIAEYE